MTNETPGSGDPYADLHDQERRARRITTAASRRIYGFTLLAIVGGGVLAWLVRNRYSWLILPAVYGGFVAGFVANRWLVARWWLRASTQGIDYEVLFQAAEHRGLMLPRAVGYPGLTPLEREIRQQDDAWRERR